MQKKRKSHPAPKTDEGWKYLKGFVGLKFNDNEKKKLWPRVKSLYTWTDDKGKDHRQAGRADLGTFIKEALFEKVERDIAPVIVPKKGR